MFFYLALLITVFPLSSTIFWLQISRDTVPLHRVVPAPNPLTVLGWPAIFSFTHSSPELSMKAFWWFSNHPTGPGGWGTLTLPNFWQTLMGFFRSCVPNTRDCFPETGFNSMAVEDRSGETGVSKSVIPMHVKARIKSLSHGVYDLTWEAYFTWSKEQVKYVIGRILISL